MIEDWSETATWLRWWRAPLLHPDLFPAIQRQFEAMPADLLCAWLGEPELEGAKLLEHREDNAWCALTREFSWDWRPTRSVATQVLEQFEVFDIDSTGLGQFADQMLAVNPIMLVRLLLSFSGRSGRHLTIDNQPFERLRNRLLDISSFSAPSEVRKQRELLLRRTAEAMDVAQEFVSKSLLLAAIRLARTEREGIEPRDNWNLQVAIANRHLVGKYLAVELLQKVIDGELR